MLFLLCSALAACSLFWSSEPQGEGRNPLILSEAPLLMLAAQGQEEGHTCPYALHCSTSLAGTTSPPTATEAQLQEAEGQASVSLTARSLKARKQPSAQYQSSLYTIFLNWKAEGKPPMGLFPVKEKIHFIILSSGDWLKKGTWLLGCSTLTDNDVLQENSLPELLKLFFQSDQVCVIHRHTHRWLMSKFRVERTLAIPLYTVICIQTECQPTSVTCTVWIINFFNYIR